MYNGLPHVNKTANQLHFHGEQNASIKRTQFNFLEYNIVSTKHAIQSRVDTTVAVGYQKIDLDVDLSY